MRNLSIILSLMMLFLVGFIPSKGASYVVAEPKDSLPIDRAVYFTTEAQKQLLIYDKTLSGDSLLRCSIAQDSTYAPAYYALSQLFAKRRGSVDSVLYYARKAYLLDSLNKWYSDFYAQGLAIKGDFAQARRLYTKAMAREPQNPQPYVMVAMLYNQTSEPQKALAILDSAEVKCGKSSYISSFKRELLLATNQRDKAIAEIEELLAIEEQEIKNYLVLADLYTSTKQDSLALKTLERALRVDSTSLEVLHTLSQFHRERGNMLPYFGVLRQINANEQESLDSKIATIKRLTADVAFYARNRYSISDLVNQLYQLYPSEREVVELLASHLIAVGELESALALYKKEATRETPSQYDYYTSVIDIESYLGRVDSVELYTSRAIELFPERHELRLARANLYSSLQRYDKALESYQRVVATLESDTLRSSVWGSIGDVRHQMSLESKPSKARRMMRKAYESYDKALELNPSNHLVLNNYAYFLSLEGEHLDSALEMSSRAIALKEGNPTYLDTYAWVLFGLGRYEEAKAVMRQVIALDTTGSAEIQFHYAEILAALGEDFMASIYYDKAAKLGYNEALIEERKERLK